MTNQADFMVHAKWVFQALLGGADVEKIQRVWPNYKILLEPGRFLIEHIVQEEKTELSQQQAALLPTPPAAVTPIAKPVTAEMQAALAAAQGILQTKPLTPVE